jgi:CheY-like chemotaxis protein
MTTNAKRPNILIVDDNLELAESFRHLLEGQGWEVTIASNGVLALKHILHKPVDVVLCDLKMPQLEGDLFFNTVERVEPALARRFVFVTGKADDPHFERFVATVKAPVLRKPVPFEQLLVAVRAVLATPPDPRPQE